MLEKNETSTLTSASGIHAAMRHRHPFRALCAAYVALLEFANWQFQLYGRCARASGTMRNIFPSPLQSGIAAVRPRRQVGVALPP
jgi:hypothetical protein